MDFILEKLASTDFGMLLAMIVIFWYFNSHTNKKIDAVDEKVTDIDRRLCRLEGAFSSKEGCLLRYDHEKSGKVE